MWRENLEPDTPGGNGCSGTGGRTAGRRGSGRERECAVWVGGEEIGESNSVVIDNVKTAVSYCHPSRLNNDNYNDDNKNNII